MLGHLFRRSSLRSSFAFSTVAFRDTVDYYRILDVQTSATQEAIQKAYAQLTQNLKPEADSQKFKQLNEAFVILTDNKTRDAYDSLLGVRKSYYLSPEEETIVTKKSYLASRKATKQAEGQKRANIDEFGRYKGGLPRKNTDFRGNSLGETGTTFRQSDIEAELDHAPEFNNITKEKAESFKDFHQDERNARTMKWPWFSFEVDYEYFTFKTFRTKYWSKIQLLLLFFYILPSFYFGGEQLYKEYQLRQLRAKAQK